MADPPPWLSPLHPLTPLCAESKRGAGNHVPPAKRERARLCAVYDRHGHFAQAQKVVTDALDLETSSAALNRRHNIGARTHGFGRHAALCAISARHISKYLAHHQEQLITYQQFSQSSAQTLNREIILIAYKARAPFPTFVRHPTPQPEWRRVPRRKTIEQPGAWMRRYPRAQGRASQPATSGSAE